MVSGKQTSNEFRFCFPIAKIQTRSVKQRNHCAKQSEWGHVNRILSYNQDDSNVEYSFRFRQLLAIA